MKLGKMETEEEEEENEEGERRRASVGPQQGFRAECQLLSETAVNMEESPGTCAPTSARYLQSWHTKQSRSSKSANLQYLYPTGGCHRFGAHLLH